MTESIRLSEMQRIAHSRQEGRNNEILFKLPDLGQSMAGLGSRRVHIEPDNPQPLLDTVDPLPHPQGKLARVYRFFPTSVREVANLSEDEALTLTAIKNASSLCSQQWEPAREWRSALRAVATAVSHVANSDEEQLPLRLAKLSALLARRRSPSEATSGAEAVPYAATALFMSRTHLDTANNEAPLETAMLANQVYAALTTQAPQASGLEEAWHIWKATYQTALRVVASKPPEKLENKKGLLDSARSAAEKEQKALNRQAINAKRNKQEDADTLSQQVDTLRRASMQSATTWESAMDAALADYRAATNPQLQPLQYVAWYEAGVISKDDLRAYARSLPEDIRDEMFDTHAQFSGDIAQEGVVVKARTAQDADYYRRMPIEQIEAYRNLEEIYEGRVISHTKCMFQGRATSLLHAHAPPRSLSELYADLSYLLQKEDIPHTLAAYRAKVKELYTAGLPHVDMVVQVPLSAESDDTSPIRCICTQRPDLSPRYEGFPSSAACYFDLLVGERIQMVPQQKWIDIKEGAQVETERPFISGHLNYG